jgi:Divergent InlB B-repeat domain
VRMRPSSGVRRSLTGLAIGFALAFSVLLAPTAAAPVHAVNFCGIESFYECIYLDLAGDGTGTVTITGYTLDGTSHPVSLACLREGGITSGKCTLGFSYLGTTSTSVSVGMQVALDSSSCFKYYKQVCGAAFNFSQSYPIQATVTETHLGFYLNNPESLTVQLQGTGSGTVTSNPRGISCPGTCSADFAAGSQVTLTATAASGDSFQGWSGGGSCLGTITHNPCTWTINSPMTIGAVFNAPTPPPTVAPTATPTARPTPTASPTPTPRPTATPSSTPRPTPTATTTRTPKPGATVIPTPASVLPTEPLTGPTPAPTEQPTPEPSSAASPTPAPSLVPIATPPVAPVSSTSDSSSFVIPILVAILAVAAYLLVARVRSGGGLRGPR